MIKKISILVLSFLLIGCQINSPKNKNNKDNSSKISYPLENVDGFKEDSSLESRNGALSLPSNITSGYDQAYTKDELKNLDYNKEILFANMYMRIPSKAKVFSKDKEYFIDLPKTSTYDITISLDKIRDDKIIDQEDLVKACNVLYNKLPNTETILSLPVANCLTNVDSAYFICKKDDYKYTHLLVKAPRGLIHFTIKENSKLSNVSSDIMTDLLIGMYKTSDDPLEVSKDFTDYTNEINIFAVKAVDLGDVSIKIPEDFYLNQDKNGIKAFISKKSGSIVSEIIFKVEDKKDKKIEDVFNSGSVIYPANIITKDLVKKDKLEGYPYMRAGANLYLPLYSLRGEKIVIETKESFLTVYVLGPVVDNNQSRIMSTAILNSIKDVSHETKKSH